MKKWIHINKDDFKNASFEVKVDVNTTSYCTCDQCEKDKKDQMEALFKEFLPN